MLFLYLCLVRFVVHFALVVFREFLQVSFANIVTFGLRYSLLLYDVLFGPSFILLLGEGRFTTWRHGK